MAPGRLLKAISGLPFFAKLLLGLTLLYLLLWHALFFYQVTFSPYPGTARPYGCPMIDTDPSCGPERLYSNTAINAVLLLTLRQYQILFDPSNAILWRAAALIYLLLLVVAIARPVLTSVLLPSPRHNDKAV
jgi:hypothetical protein